MMREMRFLYMAFELNMRLDSIVFSIELRAGFDYLWYFYSSERIDAIESTTTVPSDE